MEKGEGRLRDSGPLVDHIDSYFMDPTSFSALK